MRLTGKVTSVHSGSSYKDGQRRITLSIKSDDDNQFSSLSSLTLRDDKLQLDEEVGVVVVKSEARAQIAS